MQSVKGVLCQPVTGWHMRYRPSPAQSHRPTPAQDRARAAVTRLLAEGQYIFKENDLERIAGISKRTAFNFLEAGKHVGLFANLNTISPLFQSKRYLITEKYPGAPTSETILLRALVNAAMGKSNTMVAYAYHTALSLHGLSEVVSDGLHLIKIYTSIHPPEKSTSLPYCQKPRPPSLWFRLPNASPVWSTKRSASQVPSQDVVMIQSDSASIPVTSPLRTLIDAWMHPDWCGGMDRVADSWKYYWRNAQTESAQADLVSMLLSTAWPGLWTPLAKWASSVIPALSGLEAYIEIADFGRERSHP